MLPDKLRSIFRREGNSAGYGSELAAPSAGAPRPVLSSAPPVRRTAKTEPPVPRQSRGLEQFFFNIRDVVGLSILDCATASQDNVDFLIDLGHKIYSEDLVRGLDEAFGLDPAEQTNVSRIEYFLRQNFDYASGTFDGVLAWDALQFMSPALLNEVVERLYDVMKPKSYLLAFFTAKERAEESPSYGFRIVDNKTVMLSDRGVRPAGQVFSNRNLEKLFGKFESVKFFLTRESLREVIVRR
jgi:hypothetical protein